MFAVDTNKYLELTQETFYKKLGKVSKIVGLTVESVGPDAKLNDLCRIYSADRSQVVNAEVVGFRESVVLLMPFDTVDGIRKVSIQIKNDCFFHNKLLLVKNPSSPDTTCPPEDQQHCCNLLRFH